MSDVPEPALTFGFANQPIGSHTSRTIMLDELRLLLNVCEQTAGVDAYRKAAVDDNVLLKRTVTTRQGSFRQLRELYGLDPSVPIFRALRDMWDSDSRAQPLLAVLCAAARDPLLRTTADVVLNAPNGAPVTTEMLANAIDGMFPDRYKATVRNVIGRMTSSSWQQSGHLSGRTNKVRGQATSTPAAVAYALLLGHLCGVRGTPLFETLWARLLDAPLHVIREQAVQANRSGWLDYRSAGGITEISFRYLLRESEGVRW